MGLSAQQTTIAQNQNICTVCLSVHQTTQLQLHKSKQQNRNGHNVSSVGLSVVCLSATHQTTTQPQLHKTKTAKNAKDEKAKLKTRNAKYSEQSCLICGRCPIQRVSNVSKCSQQPSKYTTQLHKTKQQPKPPIFSAHYGLNEENKLWV